MATHNVDTTTVTTTTTTDFDGSNSNTKELIKKQSNIKSNTTTVTTTTTTVFDDSNSNTKELTKKQSTINTIIVWFGERKETIKFDSETIALNLLKDSIEAFKLTVTNHGSYGLVVRNHLNQIIRPSEKILNSLKDVTAVELINLKDKNGRYVSHIGQAIISGWLTRRNITEDGSSEILQKYFCLIKTGSKIFEMYLKRPDSDSLPDHSICLEESEIKISSDGFSFIVPSPSPEVENELNYDICVQKKAQDNWCRSIFTALYSDFASAPTDKELQFRRSNFPDFPSTTATIITTASSKTTTTTATTTATTTTNVVILPETSLYLELHAIVEFFNNDFWAYIIDKESNFQEQGFFIQSCSRLKTRKREELNYLMESVTEFEKKKIFGDSLKSKRAHLCSLIRTYENFEKIVLKPSLEMTNIRKLEKSLLQPTGNKINLDRHLIDSCRNFTQHCRTMLDNVNIYHTEYEQRTKKIISELGLDLNPVRWSQICGPKNVTIENVSKVLDSTLLCVPAAICYLIAEYATLRPPVLWMSLSTHMWKRWPIGADCDYLTYSMCHWRAQSHPNEKPNLEETKLDGEESGQILSADNIQFERFPKLVSQGGFTPFRSETIYYAKHFAKYVERSLAKKSDRFKYYLPSTIIIPFYQFPKEMPLDDYSFELPQFTDSRLLTMSLDELREAAKKIKISYKLNGLINSAGKSQLMKLIRYYDGHLKLKLPTRGCASADATEKLNTLLEACALSSIKNIVATLIMVDEDHGDNWCIYPHGKVMMANGKQKFMMDIRAGDHISDGSNGTALVEAVIKSRVGKCKMVNINGLWITEGHPIYLHGKWTRPDAVGVPTVLQVDCVYNLILAPESKHTFVVDGIQCIGLAHNLNVDGLKHPFWGTNKCKHILEGRVDWPNITI